MEVQGESLPCAQQNSLCMTSPERHKSSQTTSAHASPQRSGNKPRLLWRNNLVLQDGTHIPGVAFVAYNNPFTSSTSPDREQRERHAAQSGQEEAEAGLCLVLEMMRNKPLRIASVVSDRGVYTSLPLPRSQSLQQSMLSRSVSQGPHIERQTYYVSTGEVRVHIDPKEHSTVAYFRRLFCLDQDLVFDAAQHRSAKVLTVSLGVSGPVDDDVFGSSGAAGPNSELCIFAQPVSDSPSLRLVIGRKVIITNKKSTLGVSKALNRSRSFHRQDSIGSQALHDIFSQAGIRMPQFSQATLQPEAPRPDDPLPRGSITSMLQARSKRKSSGSTRPESRSSSPVVKIEPPADDLIDYESKTLVSARQDKKRRLSDQKVAGSPDAPSLKPLELTPDPVWIKSEGEAERCKLEPAPALLAGEIERCNRATIKKAVHNILVYQYQLTKTQADYLACYNQTCAGVYCAFRSTATTVKLDKTAVERIARAHLTLYLEPK